MKKICLLVIIVWLSLSQGVYADNIPMAVEINIPECVLRVYVQEMVLYQAPVGIGRLGHESPVGEYTIINKIVNPTWYPKDKEPVPPGPGNPLGNYWLGLSINGYGIHGNINPPSIGLPVSSGCIRMHNDDIEFMYRLITKGTKVRISYQTIALVGEDENLQIRIYPDVYNYGTTNIFKFAELVKDLEIKDKIFIPRVISLFDEGVEGVFPIPWKVHVQYNECVFNNIGYQQGKNVYIDPWAIGELIRREDSLTSFLLQCQNRYVTIEELRNQLLYHEIYWDGYTVRIETFS